MKRLARFLDPFPEAQRELYALPRWWIVLFALLAMVPFACIVVMKNPILGSAATTLNELFTAAFLCCGPLAFFSGLQLCRRLPPAMTPRQAPALLLAAMIHTYLFMLALLPFVAGVVLYAWEVPLAWQTIVMLMRLELGCLLFAGVGLLCGLYQKDLPPLTALAFYMVTVLYTLMILFDSFISGSPTCEPWEAFIPMPGLEANTVALQIGPHAEPAANRGRIAIGEAWLLGGLQQLLLLACLLSLIHDALCSGGRAIMRKKTHLLLLFTVCAVAFPLAIESLSGLEAYLAVAGTCLILSAPFLVPPHEALRRRFLESGKGPARWFSPTAPAYGWLLFATALLAWPAIAHTFVFSHGGVLRCVFLSLCTFWVWSCFVASLVEHCELYVPERGRLLAVLVSAIFLIVPSVVGEFYFMPETLRYIHPYMGLALFSYQPGEMEVIDPTTDFLFVFLHIGLIALAALAMHLWNDFQRKRLAKDMAQRIREAFKDVPAPANPPT